MIYLLLLLLSIFRCNNSSEDKTMSLSLSSAAFTDGTRIPDQYTCEGKDISPPLSWNDAPEETESFALICDDPDAPMGTWDHWVIFNIPADSEGLSEAVPTDESLTDGSKHGLNSWKNTNYGGPCPLPGIRIVTSLNFTRLTRCCRSRARLTRAHSKTPCRIIF